MSRATAAARQGAIDRANAHAPFLREAMCARPDIVETFLAKGPEMAAQQATKRFEEMAKKLGEIAGLASQLGGGSKRA